MTRNSKEYDMDSKVEHTESQVAADAEHQAHLTRTLLFKVDTRQAEFYQRT